MSWRLRLRGMGTDKVVMPDAEVEFASFTKTLGRPLVPADKEGWLTYAKRLNVPRDAASRVWRAPSASTVSEALDILNSVFESASASGTWMRYPLAMKMRHGAPSDEPLPEPAPPRNDPKSAPNIAAPPPSFPFHTKVSRNIYKKALKFIGLYPLEGPKQILRRAISAVGATPMTDITPEDEKLLLMAIDLAQSGPAKSGSGDTIGGAMGGPLNPIRPKP